jgi:alanine racemase
MDLTWVDVSKSALQHNLRQFRAIAPRSLLAPVVKANAYGHGLLQCAIAFAEAGADWLCVNAVYEARVLREGGLRIPIYVLGYVARDEMDLLCDLECRTVVYNAESIRALSAAAVQRGSVMPVHIKLETGNNRQGLTAGDAVELGRLIHSLPGIELEGVSSHYADIEDTTDHSYAQHQLARFHDTCRALSEAGMAPRIRNFSNSAAAILWSETQFDLVRIGISAYGMWPSKETFVSAVILGRDKPQLRPALTWKTCIAQVKDVKPGEFVGYGRSFRTTHPTRLAVLPVGYYDGYDRGLSNLAHVLINGRIAPVRGRVCMNMIMVDVTDTGPVQPEDPVVLLGADGPECVSAEQMGGWAGTINYEVTTRINERIPRYLVD